MKCANCDMMRDQSKGQWWNLRNYYGFNGTFCAKCYDKISHDSYGNPNNPKDYCLLLLKRNG